MKDVTSATENACPSGAHVFTPDVVRVPQFLEFCIFFYLCLKVIVLSVLL